MEVKPHSFAMRLLAATIGAAGGVAADEDHCKDRRDALAIDDRRHLNPSAPTPGNDGAIAV
jgi:hypothetical protein